MKDSPLTYESVGISYASMDPWKVLCQSAAADTAQCLTRHGFTEVQWSRGESVYLMEHKDFFLGHVQEGLGTKNLVADEMYRQTRKSHYDQIAQDLVAMIVNDMITLGVAPISLGLHIAPGKSEWFLDKSRCEDFVRGFRLACGVSGAVWGAGESPTLPQIIIPEAVELSGSGVGIVVPKDRVIKPAVRAGDSIILIESSGIHANGLSLARRLASSLPRGYLTPIDSNGTTYGSSLLVPTIIYAPFLLELLKDDVPIHYAINITGHGWRKLMRHSRPFRYTIEIVPDIPPILQFIQAHANLPDSEAYATFNMGAGFAIITPPAAVDHIRHIANTAKLRLWEVGSVTQSDIASVVIKPKDVTYSADSLNIR